MPIEARGKKDPTLAARMKSGVLPEAELVDVEYVVGRRPLKVGEETRQPGEPIPEAASWPRLESWLRSGAIVQQAPAQRTVSEPAPVRRNRPAPVTTPAEDEEPKRPVLRPRKGTSA